MIITPGLAKIDLYLSIQTFLHRVENHVRDQTQIRGASIP